MEVENANLENLQQREFQNKIRLVKLEGLNQCLDELFSWRKFIVDGMLKITDIQDEVYKLVSKINEALKREAHKPHTSHEKQIVLVGKIYAFRNFSQSLRAYVSRLEALHDRLNNLGNEMELIKQTLVSNTSTTEQLRNVQIPDFLWVENNFCADQIETLKIEFEGSRSATSEMLENEYNIIINWSEPDPSNSSDSDDDANNS